MCQKKDYMQQDMQSYKTEGFIPKLFLDKIDSNIKKVI